MRRRVVGRPIDRATVYHHQEQKLVNQASQHLTNQHTQGVQSEEKFAAAKKKLLAGC